MKVLAVFGLILLLSGVSLAQQFATIYGQVFFASIEQGGANRSGVTLTSVKDPTVEFSTQTDAEGNFKFENIPVGEYAIKATGGYSAISMFGEKRILVVSGPNSKIELVVQPTNTIRETVQVSAGQSQPIEQVSKTIDVITGREMRDRADFTLIESLRTIPGFRVQQLGGFGRTATIKTRGLRNQDTAILVDGIRFRDPSAITGDATPFLSDFTLTSVSRVEVLRGSGSSIYGTNAIGGTVDFQTPTPASGTHGQISGAFGGLGLGRFRGNVSHGVAGGKFGIGAGVSRTAYIKGIDGQDNASNTNFQTRAEFNPFSKTSISARLFVSDANVRLNTNPDTLGTLPPLNSTIINASPNVNFLPDENDPDSFQRSKFFTGQLAVNQVINSKIVVSGHYQGLSTKRTNDNGVLGPGFQSASVSIFDGTIHTGNVHLNWNPVSQITLTAGYEFESERFGNEGRTPDGTGDFFTRAGQLSNTFYVQNLVSLLDGTLQFAAGLRVQKFGIDRPEFSLSNAPYNPLTLDDPPTAYTFDGAASYFIRKTGTKLRAHVGNGYRVPSLYERFGTFFSTFGTPSFIAIGDPFLKPEKTIAFDAGIEQNLAKNRLRLSATYFHTKLIDTIGYGNVVPNIGTTPRPFGGYENQKGGIARGGEFSGTLKPKRSTDIFASYTYTNSDQRTPQVFGSGIISSLGIPKHQFTLVATQRFRRFWVNFDFLGTSDYLAPIFSNSTFNTYIYRFSGNRKGDLTAGYTFGFRSEKLTLRIYGTIENVFGANYFENGFRTFERTARAGLTFGF